PRALIAAHDTVRREIQAAHLGAELDLIAADGAAKPGETLAPVIIPGDGKLAVMRPIMRRQYPRSRKTHLALAAVAAVVLLIALIAVTPLAASASPIGAFLATSNVFALPTPVPTATPIPHSTSSGNNGQGVNPGTQAVMDDIRAVFGSTY